MDFMRWNGAKEWIRVLNNRGYAGFKDWRLPTLDEAVSLLESGRRNNLYIAPVFSDEQWGIWTGDKHGSLGVWSVYFSLGNVRWRVKNRYVRPVRSLQ
jgi:serine/threonine-protein kinase